jgi:hypothetical protein
MNAPETRPLAPLLRLVAVSLVAATAACDIVPPAQEDATQYFVLSDPASAASPAEHGPLRLGIKSVELEGYLKHREIIVRTGENEVAFRDYRRWAEPLDTRISRVVREVLASSPRVGEVAVAPFAFDQKRDYDVSIRVLRCEGARAASGRYDASFSASVEISTTGDDARVVARRTFSAPAQSWDGSNFDQLAGLLSRDAAALGRDILEGVPSKD